MFTSLKNVMEQNIRRSGISRQILAARVVEKFDQIIAEIFGEGILRKARAMYLRNDVLTVSSISSVVTQEIYLKRAKIIAELNRRLGREVVSEIKFRM